MTTRRGEHVGTLHEGIAFADGVETVGDWHSSVFGSGGQFGFYLWISIIEHLCCTECLDVLMVAWACSRKDGEA